MTIKIITHFSTLCALARNEYDAEVNGDEEAIAIAKKAHEEYRDLCLNCDGVIIPIQNDR
jgi:hypothetical protein